MGLDVDILKQLSGFTLKIRFACANESIAILGASGSGKSMLLNSIAGIIRPDSGTIALNGSVFFDSAKRIHISPQSRKAGYLFQNYALFPHMTVAQNVAFALHELAGEARQARVEQLLAQFHISEIGERYPAQISGGQQQRVALARAMAVEPNILLLDEPFSALDTNLRMQLLKEMQEALKAFGGTTLFVTHNVEEAYRLCDRILVLNQGQVETINDRETLFHRPPSRETARITGCKNIASAQRVDDHRVHVSDWGIRLRLAQTVTAESGFIGIRANHLAFAEEAAGEYRHPVFIADESEAPFRTTLYLKIGTRPTDSADYHIQCEVDRVQRQRLREQPQPFGLLIEPDKVFFMAR